MIQYLSLNNAPERNAELMSQGIHGLEPKGKMIETERTKLIKELHTNEDRATCYKLAAIAAVVVGIILCVTLGHYVTATSAVLGGVIGVGLMLLAMAARKHHQKQAESLQEQVSAGSVVENLNEALNKIYSEVTGLFNKLFSQRQSRFTEEITVDGDITLISEIQRIYKGFQESDYKNHETSFANTFTYTHRQLEGFAQTISTQDIRVLRTSAEQFAQLKETAAKFVPVDITEERDLARLGVQAQQDEHNKNKYSFVIPANE